MYGSYADGAPNVYPVGRQVFGEIRELGMLYVDKSAYVYDLTHMGGKYAFLSRPRRFGKTLLVSTLQAYFEGRRELFEGLAIEGLEHDWESYPVVRLDFSSVKVTDPEGLSAKIGDIMRALEAQWGVEASGELAGSRLKDVILAASASAGKPAVLLVDEYDAPLLNVLRDAKALPAFRDAMRELYSPLKSLEPHLRFVFLTGITKFSQLSIFSELNNIQNVSMMPQFAGVCGITQGELEGQMAPDVAYLASRLGVSTEDAYAALKRAYDGYHFCWPSPDVYNPYSLLNAMQDGMIDSYWFASGTPTSLINVLRDSGLDLEMLEGTVAARSQAFDAPTEGAASPVAFMYQSGYLTIKGPNGTPGAYQLGLPNDEVREGLLYAMLPAITGKDQFDSDSLVLALQKDVATGDMDGALARLRSFFAGIPYDLAPKGEKQFQSMLYVVLRLAGINVDTEVRTSAGRIDAVIKTAERVYVVELKYSGSAKQAIEQVESRDYPLPFAADGRQVVEVGASFDPETRTISEDWVIKEL